MLIQTPRLYKTQSCPFADVECSRKRSPLIIERAKHKRNRKRLAAKAVDLIPRMIGRWAVDSNCWGTTLFLLGETDRLRYAEDDEINAWLDAETEEVRRPAFGDVLVIRYDEQSGECYCEGVDEYGNVTDHCGGSNLDCDQPGGLCHTAVYVGAGQYLHQTGLGGTFHVSTLREILSTYPGSYTYHRRHSCSA